jgi:hypothetical protein
MRPQNIVISCPREASLARSRGECTSNLQSRPLVREGAPQHEGRKGPTVITFWSRIPDGFLASEGTATLSVGRNATLTSTEVQWRRHALLEWQRDTAVPDARGQFGNPEEGEFPTLEAVTRALVTEKT